MVAWRNNHLEGERFEVLRWRIPRQSRRELVAFAVGGKQHASLTDDAFGKGCPPKTYPHRFIVMGLMNELAVAAKPHRSDEQTLQDAATIRGQDIGFRKYLGF